MPYFAKSTKLFFALFFGTLLFTVSLHQSKAGMEDGGIKKAVAVLYPTKGNKVQGTVVFTLNGSSLTIDGDIKGLEPGKHGFHIHEYGDCSHPGAKSAGGHFNPFGEKHGAPTDKMRHVGDLGNITADRNGRARFTRIDKMISFTGEASIVGRAVVVHAGRDDFTSQPSGDAGPRVACGTIAIAEK